MLHHGCARHWKTARELTGSHGRPGEALEDDHSNGVAEQGKYPQDSPERLTVAVRLRHTRGQAGSTH